LLRCFVRAWLLLLLLSSLLLLLLLLLLLTLLMGIGSEYNNNPCRWLSRVSNTNNEHLYIYIYIIYVRVLTGCGLRRWLYIVIGTKKTTMTTIHREIKIEREKRLYTRSYIQCTHTHTNTRQIKFSGGYDEQKQILA